MLDQLDNRILRYLQNDPESSVAKLAEKQRQHPLLFPGG
jgi:DNA-binding Lrp family transcriptional regulator